MIWGALSALLLLVLKALGDALPSGWFATIPSKPLLLLLALSILLNVIMALGIYLLLREDKMELRKDGLYWDKVGNPHCPACKTPLVTLKVLEDNPTVCFRCIKCSMDIPWRMYGIAVTPNANNMSDGIHHPTDGTTKLSL